MTPATGKDVFKKWTRDLENISEGRTPASIRAPPTNSRPRAGSLPRGQTRDLGGLLQRKDGCLRQNTPFHAPSRPKDHPDHKELIEPLCVTIRRQSLWALLVPRTTSAMLYFMCRFHYRKYAEANQLNVRDKTGAACAKLPTVFQETFIHSVCGPPIFKHFAGIKTRSGPDLHTKFPCWHRLRIDTRENLGH